MSKQIVLMDHDGGVDDYLATMLLLFHTFYFVQPRFWKFSCSVTLIILKL
ncbi:MAG: hypothetical protein V7K18_08725 [Nostoc sp.]